MLTVVLCLFIKTLMTTITRILTEIICNLYAFLKNISTFFFTRKKHFCSSFKLILLNFRKTKYKVILYLYVFITMALCPWLDNLFNKWFDSEPYSMYYMFVFLFFLNLLINVVLTIPTKKSLVFDLFFIKIKSIKNYILLTYVKLVKLFFFVKNEIFYKSFIFNFFKKFTNSVCSYFVF